jgi:hypothetical protein
MPKRKQNKTYTRINPKGHKELVYRHDPDQEDIETLNELAADVDRLIDEIKLEHIEQGEVAPAISHEQPISDRLHKIRQTPLYVVGNNDIIRNNDDTITNMSGSTPMAANSPEEQSLNVKANSYYGSKSQPRKKVIGGNKDISSYSGDNIDYGDTHNEDFTGTAGIAIGPVALDFDQRKPKKMNKRSKPAKKAIKEWHHDSIDRLLLEWEPEFKSGEYSPGDAKMDSPKGSGVANKTPKRDRVGKMATDMHNHGKVWPRSYETSSAMCDVDEDGVENMPQGDHESTHGEPEDHFTKNVGHDWPNQPKHGGGGVGEPIEGNRWSDGGTLKGASTSMEWSPSNVGRLLGEEHDLQSLFDSYARSVKQVDLSAFQNLCDAHGVGVVLDESSFKNLMRNNREFIFHEHQDNIGSFWIGEQAIKEHFFFDEPDEEEGENDGDTEYETYEMPKGPRKEPINMKTGKPLRFGDAFPPIKAKDGKPMEEQDRRQSNRSMMEMQIRSPEDEAGLYYDEMSDEDLPTTDPDSESPDYDNALEDAESYERMHGAGRYDGMDDEEDMKDIDDGVDYDEEDMASGDMSDAEFFGSGYEDEMTDELLDADFDTDSMLDDYEYDSDMMMNSDMDDDTMAMESMRKAFRNTKFILENTRGSSKSHVAALLNRNWQKHGRRVQLESVPVAIRRQLSRIKRVFPGFTPICESGNMAMDAATGKPITKQKLTKSKDLADQPGPDDMTTHGSDNLLKHSQKNTYQGTPVMKGTAKGLSGTGDISEGNVSGDVKTLYRNVNRLASAIKQSLTESVDGNYTFKYQTLVTEGQNIKKAPFRSTIAEAIADLEEVLQFHSAEKVDFVEHRFNADGQVQNTNQLPIGKVYARGPVVSDGSALFRFKRNAEAFAEGCNAIGAACKVYNHGWGYSVKAPISFNDACHVYGKIRG